MDGERGGVDAGTARTGDKPAFELTVLQLRELERRAGMERVLSVGRLILERFFGGSAAAWRERRRNKNNSVRRLARHPGCPFSHSFLNQALGVYVVVRELPCVQTFEHIGASHVIAVLHLCSDGQRAWLERAEQERWSVRELKSALLQCRRLEGERRGRPRSSPLSVSVARAQRSLAALDAALDAIDSVDLFAPEQAEMVAPLRLALAEVISRHAHYLGSVIKPSLYLAAGPAVPERILRVVAS